MRAYKGLDTDTLQKIVMKSPSSDMTIYQLIPHDLHNSFFFKVVQRIMRELPEDLQEIKLFKYGMFMILHVESSVSFAHSFNEKMIEVHEDLGDGC